MSNTESEMFIRCIRSRLDSERRMIDRITAQLSDRELAKRLSPDQNSVATLMRHLGGNLASRWTDFLTTDGEKPTRNRDTEFEDWPGDRASLVSFFENGWRCFGDALDQIDDQTLRQTILIRGEPQTVIEAVIRAITHISYHVGQMAIIAREVHTGPWSWMTIAPGRSAEHNASTWGTPASRSVAGESPSVSDESDRHEGGR